MPSLKRLVIQDFRNIAFQELSFSEGINCISGNNGEGKTNLLDAIYTLAMTKSAFPVPDKFNVRHGQEAFAVGGTFAMEDGTTARFAIKANLEGEKKVFRDDKPLKRLSEHIGTLPVVMVSPGDSTLVSESGEERRRFVNGVLSQMDSEYLAAIQSYNRLLLQRNRLLKDNVTPDEGLLAVFDARMAPLADSIHSARAAFTKALNPVVQHYYHLISGGNEPVSIRYESDLANGPLDKLLAARRDKDLALRYTSAGIQRDDFLFEMDGYPVRRCGSQGQQKSFLVALKFAQYSIMKDGYGFAPTLLLDDVFDKLDMGRISNLIALVAGKEFGQIFITDSNKVRLSGIVDALTEDRAYFDTVGGTFRRIDV